MNLEIKNTPLCFICQKKMEKRKPYGLSKNLKAVRFLLKP